MTLEQIVWDLRTLMGQAHVESSFTDELLIQKINSWRAVFLFKMIEQGDLQSIFIQELGVLDVTPTSSLGEALEFKDEKGVSYTSKFKETVRSSVLLGKIELPTMVTAGGFEGVVRVSNPAKNRPYSCVSDSHFWDMYNANDEFLKTEGIYYKEGNEVFLFPFHMKMSILAVLANPLEGYTRGSYLDYNGEIHGSASVKRNLTIYDQYPCSPQVAQNIILNILTNDYKLAISTIDDLIKDNEDQFKVVKNYAK